MSLVLEHALLDSIALQDAAKTAGITTTQARAFAAALGEMPAEQSARIIGETARQKQCERERMRRMGR